jgi:penicillin-insensitive murein DD-endopeptidase
MKKIAAFFILLSSFQYSYATQWNEVEEPTESPITSVGTTSNGCLSGGQAMPFDGEGFQMVRTSRYRYFGNPKLVLFLQQLAKEMQKVSTGILLIGDMSQPRGGPMNSMHASHQNGLDADIWLWQSPQRLSNNERENFAAPEMVRNDRINVTKNWTQAQVELIRLITESPEVERVFLNAAIKKALCDQSQGQWKWLRKVRPWWGHDRHVHVRLHCPENDPYCKETSPIPAGDGCHELDWWFSEEALNPKKSGKKKATPKPALPAFCNAVLNAK